MLWASCKVYKKSYGTPTIYIFMYVHERTYIIYYTVGEFSIVTTWLINKQLYVTGWIKYVLMHVDVGELDIFFLLNFLNLYNQIVCVINYILCLLLFYILWPLPSPGIDRYEYIVQIINYFFTLRYPLRFVLWDLRAHF